MTIETIAAIARGNKYDFEALRKDAERYRWLRESRRIPQDAAPEEHIVVCASGGEDVLWSGALDAAIDAAMKEQQ